MCTTGRYGAAWLDGPTANELGEQLRGPGRVVNTARHTVTVMIDGLALVSVRRRFRPRTAASLLWQAARAGEMVVYPTEVYTGEPHHPLSLFVARLLEQVSLPPAGAAPSDPIDEIAVALIMDQIGGVLRHGSGAYLRLASNAVATLGGVEGLLAVADALSRPIALASLPTG
jgi:hypothetical protein